MSQINDFNLKISNVIGTYFVDRLRFGGALKPKAAGQCNKVKFGGLEAGVKIVQSMFVFQIDIKRAEGKSNTGTESGQALIEGGISVGRKSGVCLNPSIVVIVDKQQGALDFGSQGGGTVEFFNVEAQSDFTLDVFEIVASNKVPFLIGHQVESTILTAQHEVHKI